MIADIKEDKDKVEVFVEIRTEERICPCCGRKESTVHDTYIQKLRDLDILDKKTFIILKKKRYKCKCGKKFLERNNFSNKRQRMTKRFEKFILYKLEKQSANSLSKEIGVSVNTLCRIKKGRDKV